MSSFRSDLAQEKILAEYLDTIYAKKELDFKRTNDLDLQLQGVDIIINFNEKEYLIDEKAQLHYLNADLPTFTFELSYLKNGILKDGWLFDPSKNTHYYFLISGIFLKDDKEELSHADDIKNIKITSVNRNKLIEHLTSIRLDRQSLGQYDLALREGSSYGSNVINELDARYGGQMYYTKHLTEQPMNLQLRLSYLIQHGVAKKFYYQ